MTVATILYQLPEQKKEGIYAKEYSFWLSI